ncbi:NAD(P)-binding protein [Corynespora cassiicola Philippines]|uniref:NAD(P)-binding protein n=1 Tax=Corynespora cassiicola Philippines TaxID=1448308 RepID=A0A2T2NJW5_CORCC|nr:NAD(P)-binding protein [Corynespora cassiicola Philippines]
MATSTVVFITGAGRGIGKGLTEAYLQRPNHIVIGSVRDSSSPSYDELKKTSAASGSRLILVSLDASHLDSPAKAVKVAEDAGISHVDIVIANAGISSTPGPLAQANLDEVVETLHVNSVSPIALYQAVLPLLEKSQKPIWISMSSAAGSIGNLEVHQAHYLLGYGISKAAMNFFTVAIHAAHPNIIAYAIHPGLVQTDLGNTGAKMQGMEKAPITLEDSCAKIMASADNATREKTSSKFLDIMNDGEFPY